MTAYFFLLGALWESAEAATDLLALLVLPSRSIFEAILATFLLVRRCAILYAPM